jgi:hypothetical protein
VKILLAWLVQNMSTHGGEETWLMTLTNIYTKLDNTRNLIPGKSEPPKRKKREKGLRRKKHSFQNYTYPCVNMQS